MLDEEPTLVPEFVVPELEEDPVLVLVVPDVEPDVPDVEPDVLPVLVVPVVVDVVGVVVVVEADCAECSTR